MINPEEYNYQLRDVSSAWKGLERYIQPIINQFNINPINALEFGVDLGYSSEVFSNLFQHVTGVDAFMGDIHIIHQQGNEFYENIKNSFKGMNVDIVRSLFQDFIHENNNIYDLIHIDIVHEYEPTYKCAEWAIQHSNVVLLHDTMSFPEIDRVCQDLSNKYNINYYNIPHHFGLGILYKNT